MYPIETAINRLIYNCTQKIHFLEYGSKGYFLNITPFRRRLGPQTLMMPVMLQ